MSLPFTQEEFFGLFTQYNQTFGLFAIGLWVAAALAVLAGWKDPSRHSRTVGLMLAALWIWNALVYHAFLFTRINPAAWLFAGAFGIEGALLLWSTRLSDGAYFSGTGWKSRSGHGLVTYAFAYPVLNMTLGHPYPATPTFGVPCPTAILTIGVLLTTGGRVPVLLSIVPALWGFVGGSAALLLTVWPDYVLLVAGLLLTVAAVTQRKGHPHSISTEINKNREWPIRRRRQRP